MTESQKKISTYLKKICSSACLTTSNQQEQVGTVEVVVPVFNATEAVKTCIAALLNHTSPKHRITLLDDASDDPELIIYYQQLQSNHPQTNIIRRESNLGYLQNVNLYLNDLNHAVVLLNSDTQVTAGWLDAMLAVASDSRVGMVCPLSDNATILTLKNHKPNHIDQLQGLFKQWYPIPTAVGFCLLIKAGWWQKLGGFDPYYQPGYGEENELSLQLRAQGSQVACAPAAFVYHSGSASFQQQTQTLQDQHQKMLNLRWPGNLAEIKRFSTTNPANYIDLWLQATTHHKPRMLHVVHGIDNKGGVELFTRQLLSNLGNDCHHTVLLPARISQHSTRRGTQSDQPFEILELDQNNFPLDHRIFHLPADLYQQPLDVHFKHVLEWGGFGHVHFHSMVGVGTAMWPQICHTLGITYDLFLHDHSALCQIFSLSTTQHQQEVYCGKTQAEPHSDTCQQCLADKTQETKLTTESYMALRHKIWQQHINNAAQIQVCSDYLLHTLSLHFKEIENRTVVINPSFAPSLVAPVSQPDPKALNVAFLGQFGVLKGAQLFIDLYHELSNQTFNWHIIGGIDSRFKIQLKATHITTTGSYEPEELPKLLADIDLIVFTSQIPETYGLTLTEALIHGVPVVAPDLGAYADRVQPGVNGFLYQFNRLEGLAKAVIQLSQLQCSPNRIEQTIWEAQPIDIIQQFNDHYLETIQAHAVELPQHQENLPSLPIPGFNAWQTMKAWLDAPRTLEAAADWHPLPESFKIFILGSDQALISATQDHLKILMPTAQFASQLNQDDVKAQGTEVVLLVDAGNRINENLGNWLAWFTASDAVLGLADFALHDQRQASYAPQFLGAFSWQNLCASGHNLGAALTKPSTWNPAVFADLTGRKLNVRSLLLAVHHHHPADIDHFPYFSYTMLDQQFVQHWKQLLHTKQPSPPPVKATVLLETNLTGKPLERLKKHLGQQTLLQQKQAKLICYPSTDRGVVVDKMTDSKNPIFVLTDNVRMTDKTGLERWLNALITQHMDVLSMPAARDQSRSWLIGKKAGASNHIQGVGRIKDLRFMLPEMAWQHDWIDDDFWLFSDVAWHSAAPIYRHDHSLFTAVKLSHHLQKQGMSCGIFPDQTMFKKGLPSLNPKQHKTPLNKQRDELIADQMHRPVDRHYPRAYGCRHADQLDLITTPFKTPKKLPRVVAYAQDDWASGFYRIKSPLNALAANNHISVHFMSSHAKHPTPSPHEISRLDADCLVLHGFYSDQQLTALNQYKKQLQVPIIISLDDLLTALPDYNPMAKQIPTDIGQRIRLACQIADKLLVSTTELANHCQHLHDHITVIPNRLTQQLWPLQADPQIHQQRLRVGWAGAGQHQGDLDFLTTVVKQTSQFCDWVFFGDRPNQINEDSHEFHPPVNILEYPDKLQELQLDVAVAPLLDNAFNRCKSPLKLLEYGVLGLPVLASNLSCYQDTPATLLENKTEPWVKQLNLYHQQRALLKEHGNQLQQWVHQHFWLEDHAYDWLSLLDLNQSK